MNSRRQIQICRMIQGDLNLIFECLQSQNELVRMDALLWAAYHGFSESNVASRIIELKNDDTAVMGFTVSDYAIAALDRLNIEKYSGKDFRMEEFIRNFVPTKQEVEEILRRNNEQTA